MSRPTSTTGQRSQRVPYAAILPARQVAVIAFAFPFLAHLVDTARLVLTREEDAAALVVALVMLLVCYEFARRAFCARQISFAALWLVTGVVASSGLELGYCLHNLHARIPEHALEATARANFLAGPLTHSVYALVFLISQMRFVAESSDESADQAVVVAAVWLGLAYLSTIDSGPSLVLSRTSTMMHSSLARHLTTTVPLLFALAALARLILRRRWLSIVSSGRDPRWHLVLCDGDVPACLPSLARTRAGAPSMVLVTVYPNELPHHSTERSQMKATLCPWPQW
jgi:hypothetical protein